MSYEVMNDKATERHSSLKGVETSLAFQYEGVHVHQHCRTQGLILAASEQEARLLLRGQQVVALRLSLVSAANPLVSAQSATAQLHSPWQALTSRVTGGHDGWRTQTFSLLATALDQAPLLQALAIVERQLTALKAPAVWPAALLVWRDGLAKGLSCSQALQPFAGVWGSDWLAWVQVCELQGMPLAPLAPWIQVQQHRNSLQVALRPTVWRCYGWGIAMAVLILAGIIKNPHQAMAVIGSTLGMALPVVLAGGWMMVSLKKKLASVLEVTTEPLRCGWAAWWMALHLQARDADNVSPLEALQMAVQIPSAQHATFLHQALAAVEAGQPLEVALSHSHGLSTADRLCFEAVQDSVGLRQAIEACWHRAEEQAQTCQLRWLVGIDILLTLATVGLTVILMR